jgi:hypothetical protein
MEADDAEIGKRGIGDFGEVGDFVDFPEVKFGGRRWKTRGWSHESHEKGIPMVGFGGRD